MSVRRRLLLLAAVGMLTVVPSRPALASDSEFGTLSCPGGRVVWVTERTSAGTTTVSFNGGVRRIVKQGWSTSKTRTGLRATWWRVTTTGLMDHPITGASCGA